VLLTSPQPPGTGRAAELAAQAEPLTCSPSRRRAAGHAALPQIFSQADTSLKRWALEFAAKRKKAEVRNGIIRNDSLWDKLFFNKIQVSNFRSESKVKGLSCLPAMPGFA